MKSRSTLRLWPVVLLLVLAASLEAAIAAGGFAYTKRFKTVLLAEPSPLAAPAGELALGRKLAVKEVRGSWLRVNDGPATGWVFNGNLSENKPEETKGVDGLPIAASQTTATAAARPLTPAAVEYAERKNLGSAREDLDWLLEESKAFTPEEVTAYMQAQKKGEFQ